MKGNEMSVRELKQLLQVTSYEPIPFSESYDEQELACRGSEWYSAVAIFNTCVTGPQFRKLSRARKCKAVRTLLDHPRLMDEVYYAYCSFREIAFDNRVKYRFPTGPLFQFDNGINPHTWSRPPTLVNRYPVVRVTDDDYYLRLEGPWFQFVNTTDPRTWEAPPQRLIQYPAVHTPHGGKVASVGITIESEADLLFQYASREDLDKVVRAYIDRLTHPQCVQEKWISTPASHLDGGMLSRHVLDGGRLKMTVGDIEVGCLHRLVVEELPTIINVWIATEVIRAHRYDEIVASDAA